LLLCGSWQAGATPPVTLHTPESTGITCEGWLLEEVDADPIRRCENARRLKILKPPKAYSHQVLKIE
jgi:hypothetical protein